MNRHRYSFPVWGHFVVGVLIGLLVVTPALAMAPDLPIAVTDDTRLYLLIGSGVLLFLALVMRLLRRKETSEPVVTYTPGGYGMRFFPSDRPIAIE